MYRVLISAVVVAISASASANTSDVWDGSCEYIDYSVVYKASLDEADFFYLEKDPGSFASEALIVKTSKTGQIDWKAIASRGCSQGVSKCFLDIPFHLSDQSTGEINSEMNFFSIGTRDYFVASHLLESIITVYAKSHPFQTMSLETLENDEEEGLQNEDFIIPNLFQDICRDSWIGM